VAQLGIRNNNWLNVRYSPNNDWIGQTGSDSSDYAQFQNPVYGIRAADKVLENYKNIHGINTVADTISRYAPPSDDNPTDNYINYVSNRLGVAPNDSIDLSNPNTRASMMRAMVGFETPDAASQFTPELLAEARGISGEQAASAPVQRRPVTSGRRTFLVTDRVSGKQLRVSGNRAPTEADLQSLFQPYRSGSAGDRTILGQIGETGKAIPRGFARGILSSVEGLAELADAATNFIGLDNLIDSGDENELVRLVRAGKESLNEGFMGADEAYQDAWLTKFGEGLGSMASFLTPGGVARLAGVAGKSLRLAEFAGAGSLATTMYAGEQAERIKMARDSGIEVSEGEEDLAVVLGAIAGLTELAPVYRLFSRIPKVAGYTFGQKAMRNITEAIKSGGVEAIQEVTGLWLQNAIERGIYNENLPKGQSMWDEFTIGGAVGMTADLLLRAFSGRRAIHSTEVQRSREAALRESMNKTMEGLPVRLSKEQAVREARALAEKSDLSEEDKERVLSEVLEKFQPDNKVTLEDINSASIIDSIDMSEESYPTPIFTNLYEIGMSVLNPEMYNITSTHIDHAANTTNAEGYQEESSEGVADKNLTASQKYNRDRKNRGLDEVSTFSIKEAKEILKDNFNNLPELIGTEDRETYTAEKDAKGNDYVLSTAGEEIRSMRVSIDGSFEPITNRRQALALARKLNKHEDPLIPPEVIKTIRGSKKSLRKILEKKNISSSIESPEIRYLAEKMTGQPDVNKMTSGERKIFYNRLRKFPILEELTRLPLFRRRNYTKLQWNKALSEVKRSGDPRAKNIQRAANLRGKNALQKAKAIRKEMVDQGVIVKNKVVSYEKQKAAVAAGEAVAKKTRKAREKPPNKLLEPLMAALEKPLKAIGLGDVALRVNKELEYAFRDENDNMVVGARIDEGKFVFDEAPSERTEAYYEANIKTIFLGLDKIAQVDSEGNPLTEEQILSGLTDLLNHETVHALRNLDLFTENEWFILENAARTLTRRDTGGTFYELAQNQYADQSPVIQMEEAIAELIRYGRKDPKLVGGKPRNLIQRVMDFLERVYSAMRGTGFNSYGDIIASLERGEIGGRRRDEVRTLLRTELEAEKIPERGIGLTEEEEKEALEEAERRRKAGEKEIAKEIIGTSISDQAVRQREDFPPEVIREARRVSLEERVEIESGTVDDFVVLESDPAKQEEIRTFIRGRRVATPPDIREARHVSADFIWHPDYGIMEEPYRYIGRPSEYDKYLTPRAKLALEYYVEIPHPFAVSIDSDESRLLEKALDFSEPVVTLDPSNIVWTTQDPTPRPDLVNLDKKRLFELLIDDLIANNKPYRNRIKQKLSEAGISETFTVYRGRREDVKRGWKFGGNIFGSVSTNRATAEGFGSVVDAYTIRDEDILALGASKEGELIVRFPDKPDSTTAYDNQKESDESLESRDKSILDKKYELEARKYDPSEAIGIREARGKRELTYPSSTITPFGDLEVQASRRDFLDSPNRAGVIPEIEELYPLLNVIRDPKNAEGFTIRIDGRPIPKIIESGYVLAPLKAAEHIVSVKDIRLKDVVKFADDIRRVADVTGRDVYAGGWEKGGNYYLDAVSIFNKLPEALYTAEDGEQEAIFDLGEFSEIYTKEGIGRLKETGAYEDKARNVIRRNNQKDRFEFEKARDRDRQRPVSEYRTNLERYVAVESARESRRIDPLEISTRRSTKVRFNKKHGDMTLANGVDAFINTLDDFMRGKSAKFTAMGEPRKKGQRKKEGAITTLAFAGADVKAKDFEDRIEWLADFAKNNILFLYDSVPEQIREVTRRWYEGANLYANRLAEEKDISVSQASGVIAALSPQQEWDINVSLSERVIDIYQNEQDTEWTDEMLSTYESIFIDNKNINPKTISRNRKTLEIIKNKTLAEVLENESVNKAAFWLRTYDQAHNDRSYRVMFPEGYFLDQAKTKDGNLKTASWNNMLTISNSIGILQDGSIENISRNLGEGNKVSSFYNNILNPNSVMGHVTVDSHAVAAAYLLPLSGTDTEVSFNFGTQKIPTDPRVPKGASISNDSENGFYGVYPILEEAYRRAARERGILPREMQSVVWEAEKSLFTRDYKGRGAKNTVTEFWEDYANGKEDLETTRNRIYGHAKGSKEIEPEYWRSHLGRLEEIQRAVDAGELPGSSFSRSAGEPALGRGARVDDPRIVEAEGLDRPPPTTLPAEGIEEVVAQNIRESREVKAGLIPRFSQNASPEAQYVARNPDEGTPLSDVMSARYSRKLNAVGHGGYVDRLAGDELPNSTPMNAFMDAANIHGWDRFKMWMTKIKQSAVNNWARLETISQDPKFRDLYGSSSAMAAALMASRSRGLVASALKYGVIVYEGGVMRVVNEKMDRHDKRITGLMDGMVRLYSNSHLTGKDNVNLEKLAKAYAIATREVRLSKEGKIVRVGAKEREDAMKEIEAKIGKYINRETGKPIVKEWYEWWQDYNEHTITWLKNTGVIDAKAAEQWANYSDYYPFYEEAQNNPNLPESLKIFSGMTGTTDFDPVKGSSSPLNMPMLDAITRNLATAIDMGMKNVAQQRIVRDQLELNMARDITDQKSLHTRAHTVVFKVKGEKKVYEIVDPLLHESLLAMGQGDLHWVVNSIFGPASQLLRETVTKDPAFMLVNMMRDTMSAYVTSGSNFVPVIDTVKGFFGGDMKELEMLGVVGGYDFSNDPKDIVKFMKRLAAKRGTPIGSIRREGEFDLLGRIEQGFEDPVLKPFKTLWQGLGAVTTRSDAATRWAVYEDVLERTGDLGEAQIQALEIINFSRRGNSTMMRSLTAAIPFLNARMQGVDVLYRAFTGRYGANKDMQRTQVVKTAVLRGGMLLAVTYIYWMLVSDEDEYKDARPEVRDDYFLIPLTSIGIDEVLRLPIPFEVGVIFKTIPERIFEATMGDDTSSDVRKSMQRAILNTLELNPAQAQAIGPLVEAWMNHDFYTGRSVVPLYMEQDVARGLQDTFGTRELAVKIGQALNISPIKIDHMMTGYAGTLGVYALDVIDWFLRSEGRIQPARRIDQYPVIKRFFASPRGGGLQEKFYELNNEIREMVTTMNRLNRQGRYDELNAFVKTRQGLIEIRDNVNYVAERMSEYRLQRDIIQRSSLDPAAKRERLEILEAEITLMLRVAPELKRIANISAFRGVR